MECINHSGVAAAGACQRCGKALCADCMRRFDPPLCEDCLLTHNASVARSLYVDLAVTVLVFAGVAVGLGYMTEQWGQGNIVIGLFMAGAYWGWQFLNTIPTPVFFMSGFGLIVYLTIKLCLAMTAGLLVAPWQIFKRIRTLTAIAALKKKVQRGEA